MPAWDWGAMAKGVLGGMIHMFASPAGLALIAVLVLIAVLGATDRRLRLRQRRRRR